MSYAYFNKHAYFEYFTVLNHFISIYNFKIKAKAFCNIIFSQSYSRFLERRFRCVNESGSLADAFSFFLNIPGKNNNLVAKTKLFHFHGILKKMGAGWGSSEPLEPTLDPPPSSMSQVLVV